MVVEVVLVDLERGFVGRERIWGLDVEKLGGVKLCGWLCLICLVEFMKRKQTEARARARILQNKAAAAAAGTAGTTGTTVPVAVPPVKP